ncbi:2TM domain-containing protein [uncultured Maribacter sp.]|uniref:2TM domain-containing protein n=1 Tax=uncultured Maribacter sp. TaxID=431308 RepID=UPI002608692B|nr:2TM domain-containing protein [uncultured Maribacter sp.]
MEIKEGSQREKLRKAKKRVADLKGYYGHLAAYIAVNTFISVAKIIGNINNGETFSEAFFDFNTFAIWAFWGIGLFFHTIKIFSLNPLFGRDWEEKQIQKFMEEDRRESEKFR